MSFASFVSKTFGKRPVWLYRIEVAGVTYHYTSKGGGYTTPNDRPNTDFPTGQVWTSAPIVRGELYQTTLANRTDTWIRLPTSNALIAAIIANKDYDRIDVDIWQGFIGDPDNEFRLMFSGRVVDVEPTMLLTTLVCETSLSEASRSSVAQVVQRSCRHAHYFTNADGGGCRLALADHQTSMEVTEAAGRVLTVPDAANEGDGHYLAGILEYDSKEYMITSHIGSAITVENPIEGMADAIALGTTTALLAPGCDLTIRNCAVFDNVVNFGGFNDMDDSAFDGRSII